MSNHALSMYMAKVTSTIFDELDRGNINKEAAYELIDAVDFTLNCEDGIIEETVMYTNPVNHRCGICLNKLNKEYYDLYELDMESWWSSKELCWGMDLCPECFKKGIDKYFGYEGAGEKAADYIKKLDSQENINSKDFLEYMQKKDENN